jgi:hypothetical protein
METPDVRSFRFKNSFASRKTTWSIFDTVDSCSVANAVPTSDHIPNSDQPICMVEQQTIPSFIKFSNDSTPIRKAERPNNAKRPRRKSYDENLVNVNSKPIQDGFNEWHTNKINSLVSEKPTGETSENQLVNLNTEQFQHQTQKKERLTIPSSVNTIYYDNNQSPQSTFSPVMRINYSNSDRHRLQAEPYESEVKHENIQTLNVKQQEQKYKKNERTVILTQTNPVYYENDRQQHEQSMPPPTGIKSDSYNISSNERPEATEDRYRERFQTRNHDYVFISDEQQSQQQKENIFSSHTNSVYFNYIQQGQSLHPTMQMDTVNSINKISTNSRVSESNKNSIGKNDNDSKNINFHELLTIPKMDILDNRNDAIAMRHGADFKRLLSISSSGATSRMSDSLSSDLSSENKDDSSSTSLHSFQQTSKRGRKPNSRARGDLTASKVKLIKNNLAGGEKPLVYFGAKAVVKHTDEYKVRREYNNEAVKKCREKLIVKQREREARMSQLESGRKKLEVDNEQLRRENKRLVELMGHVEAENRDLSAVTDQLVVENKRLTGVVDQLANKLNVLKSVLS